MADKQFADGMRASKPKEGSASFVIARLGIEVSTFTKFLEDHANERGYVDIDILESRTPGKYYAALNKWEPKLASGNGSVDPQPDVNPQGGVAYPKEEINPDDIPF